MKVSVGQRFVGAPTRPPPSLSFAPTPRAPPQDCSQEPWLLTLPPPSACRRGTKWPSCRQILSTAQREGKGGPSHFADEEMELQEDRGLARAGTGEGWSPVSGPGLQAQGSHPSRRLQETAGFYNEKRRTGEFTVGFLGKKETDLPQRSDQGVARGPTGHWFSGLCSDPSRNVPWVGKSTAGSIGS